MTIADPSKNTLYPKVGMKEGNVLFNDAIITFYLRLYGVRHMVKDHSDSEKGLPVFGVNRVCLLLPQTVTVYSYIYIYLYLYIYTYF